MRKDFLVLMISFLIFVVLRRCESSTSDPTSGVYVIFIKDLKRKSRTKGFSSNSQNGNKIGLREETLNIWKQLQQYVSDKTPKTKNLEQHKCRVSFGSMYGVKASKILCQNKPPTSGSPYDVEIKKKTPNKKEVKIPNDFNDLTRSTDAKTVEKTKESNPMTLWLDKTTFVAVKQNKQNKRKIEPGDTILSSRPSERASSQEDYSENIAYDYYDRKEKPKITPTVNAKEFLAKLVPKRKKKVHKKYDSILKILPTLPGNGPDIEDGDSVEEFEDYDQILMDSVSDATTKRNVRRSPLRLPTFLPKRYNWDSDELQRMGRLWYDKRRGPWGD